MTRDNRALVMGALVVSALGGLALAAPPAAADRCPPRRRVIYERDVVNVREPYYPVRRVRDCDDWVVRVREYVDPCPRYTRVVHQRDCRCSECRPVARRHRCDRYCDHW